MIKNYINEFAVFILSHGRADNVITYNTLINKGYSGKIYILCDDGDSQLNQYKEIYGDKVIVFSKKDYENKFDKMDNFDNDKSVIYARNAVYDCARKLGIQYICVTDDDYTNFAYRVTKDYQYYPKSIINNINSVFNVFINFLVKSKVRTICFCQGGDFMGGSLNNDFAIKKIPKRKMMNLFFFNVDNEVKFISKLNDDVTTSLAEGIIGNVVLTCPLVSLTQKETQTNKGGLTDIYLKYGTYVKSFYSVMYAPSAVKISTLNSTHSRIHHKVKWNNVAPKIIREGT